LTEKKVLLIDDERDFLEALSERMRNRGLNVATAASATEALRKAEKETYDVLVLDLNMPEMDGLETLKILKGNNPRIHVIILTGHASVENGISAMLSGAEEILEKPSNVDTLIKKIEKLLAKKMVKV
jgi:DNA-binding NtrC family response regulator